VIVSENRELSLVVTWIPLAPAAIDVSLVDKTLEARRNQVLVPLLSVAPDRATREAIAGLSKNDVPEAQDDVRQHLRTILQELLDQGHPKGVPVKAVAAALRASGRPAYAHVQPRYVGSLLRRVLGLSTAKRHGIYVIPAEQLSQVPSPGIAARRETADHSKADHPK